MITPLNLLERAKVLSDEHSEIEWRESIKQSYYYVYHCLKSFLNAHNINLMYKDMGEHQFDIERLKTIEHRLAYSLARDIQILKDKRVMACYFLNENISRLQAKQQLKECLRVISKLEQLNNELTAP